MVELEQFQMTKEEAKELKQVMKGMTNEGGSGAPCTPQQRGYIYGLCKKLDLDPRNLPEAVSPKPETRDLTIAEAASVITFMKGEL